jgi:hypothetical protein
MIRRWTSKIALAGEGTEAHLDMLNGTTIFLELGKKFMASFLESYA